MIYKYPGRFVNVGTLMLKHLNFTRKTGGVLRQSASIEDSLIYCS